MAELMVALDFSESSQAVEFAGEIQGVAPWVKVGLELFTASGPSVVSSLRNLGFKVFLDLKFHDIPNTVKGAVASAARIGADMINLHLLGGERMIMAALEGREQGTAPGAQPPLLIGVTLLTSMGPEDLVVFNRACEGAPENGELADAVLDLARSARSGGLDGVVCSGFEVQRIKSACGRGFLTVCPGVRLESSAVDDQRRVMTPDQAVKNGADFLVVGRPITRAPSPAQACEKILGLMSGKA